MERVRPVPLPDTQAASLVAGAGREATAVCVSTDIDFRRFRVISFFFFAFVRAVSVRRGAI
jgi:hypothetical protein